MIYRRLDSDGDYMLGQSMQNFVSDIEAVRQAIYTRLLLLQTEWWEDLEDGLPLWQQILGFHNAKDTADSLIIDRILNTENVLDMMSFDSVFNAQDRKYTFSATVSTTYGRLTIQEASV